MFFLGGIILEVLAILELECINFAQAWQCSLERYGRPLVNSSWKLAYHGRYVYLNMFDILNKVLYDLKPSLYVVFPTSCQGVMTTSLDAAWDCWPKAGKIMDVGKSFWRWELPYAGDSWRTFVFCFGSCHCESCWWYFLPSKNKGTSLRKTADSTIRRLVCY